MLRRFPMTTSVSLTEDLFCTFHTTAFIAPRNQINFVWFLIVQRNSKVNPLITTFCKSQCNNRKVLARIPEADRAEEVKNLEFNRETDLTERALGVQWSIKNDAFKFRTTHDEARYSFYSKFRIRSLCAGFVAPVLLEGKLIL